MRHQQPLVPGLAQAERQGGPEGGSERQADRRQKVVAQGDPETSRQRVPQRLVVQPPASRVSRRAGFGSVPTRLPPFVPCSACLPSELGLPLRRAGRLRGAEPALGSLFGPQRDHRRTVGGHQPRCSHIRCVGRACRRRCRAPRSTRWIARLTRRNGGRTWRAPCWRRSLCDEQWPATSWCLQSAS